jgi:hypothetical protein
MLIRTSISARFHDPSKARDLGKLALPDKLAPPSFLFRDAWRNLRAYSPFRCGIIVSRERRIHVKSLAILALAPALMAAFALALGLDLSGTYKATLEDTVYILTLKEDGKGGLSGTLTEGEDRFDLKGTVSGSSAKGKATLASAEESFDFTLRKDGAKLVMELFDNEDGEMEKLATLAFTLSGAPAKGSAPPKKETAPPKKPAEQPKAPAAKATGAAQRLVWGPTFSLPKGWTFRQAAGDAVLVPPQARPTERYFSPVVAVPPGTNASQESFAQSVQEYVAQATAGMQLVANKVLTTKSGPGRLLAFEGGGNRLHVYATVHDNLAVGLIAAGPKATLLSRADDLATIFASFAKGRPQQDPNLVGTWRYSSRSGNTDRDSYNHSTRTTIAQLAPDGRFAVQTNSRSVLSGDGFHAESGTTGAVFQGRWFAGGGVLVLVGEGGDAEMLTYSIGQGFLKIADRDGKTEYYEPASAHGS